MSKSPRIDVTQALSAMAEQWNVNTDKLTGLAVGMALSRFGIPQVSFTVEELQEFARTHIVTRNVSDTPRGLEWCFKVLPINPHPGQRSLDFRTG